MKEFSTTNIRNIVLASHSNSGKTLLVENLLNFTGATTRIGSVEDGTTVSDFDDEEKRRNISLFTSVLPVIYKNIKFNFLDTPGYTDFVGEVVSAMRVADCALILVDSVGGLEVGTETALDLAAKFNIPRIMIINKMDRDNASYEKAFQSVRTVLDDVRLIPMQLPWGEKADFQGVIDLVTMKAYKGDGKTATEIPAEMKDEVEEARMVLVEAAAEGEDSLLEKYFENGDLTSEEILQGLRKAIKESNIIPVLVAAGGRMIGIAPLMDALLALAPSPAELPAVTAKSPKGDVELKIDDSGPLAAYVWKTTADPFVGRQTFFRVYSGTMNSDTRVWNANKGEEERLAGVQVPYGKDMQPVAVIHSGDIGAVAKLSVTTTGDTLTSKEHSLILPAPSYPNPLYRVAITPKTQSDAAKMSQTLNRLAEEDMTFSWDMEAATHQTLIFGMGDQHINVAVKRAEQKFQLNLDLHEPKVPYEEHITKEASAMYRHKKQTGGSGQFGEVHLKVFPIQGEEFTFSNDVFGGAISNNYMSPIEKGIRNVMKEGVVAGYPIHNVGVSVFDGKEHPVDSKPVAFEIAGREAFKIAFKDANPVLYEPIMKVTVHMPEANMGDIMGDLNTRRARVQGMNSDRGRSTITAEVPLSEMMRYTTNLRSMTGGRGTFSMEFDHYDLVPSHLAQEVMDARQRELKHEE
ncbi:MAG: elongation factor G [Anaerolineaceae bacterium]|jgi:elongation factor G|nr:elongation factor G [Anaerolineaceae bacterium]